MRARADATNTHPLGISTLDLLPAPLVPRPLPSHLCQVLLSAVPTKTMKKRKTTVTMTVTSAFLLQNQTRLLQPPLPLLPPPVPFIPTNQPSLHPKPPLHFRANSPSTHNNRYNHNSHNLRPPILPHMHLLQLSRILRPTTIASSTPSPTETST